MKGENKVEKQKSIAVYHCNNDGRIYFIQHNDSNGRAIG